MKHYFIFSFQVLLSEVSNQSSLNNALKSKGLFLPEQRYGNKSVNKQLFVKQPTNFVPKTTVFQYVEIISLL